MKRFTLLLAASCAVFVSTNVAQAGWGSLHYGGWQPWWNIFAHRNRALSPEERRLQQFWHDYYNALKRYYDLLDNIDWVAYYKNHGYQINAGCGYGMGPCGGPQRIQFAPVFVSPTMQWAVPNAALNGPPAHPPVPPAQLMYGAPGGMMPPPGMPQHGVPTGMPQPPVQGAGYFPGAYPYPAPTGYPTPNQ